MDSSGLGIPEVTITLRQLSSSAARILTTGDAGQFLGASLPIGLYSLRVEKSGFNPVNVDALTISVGQTVTQRIVMSPGFRLQNGWKCRNKQTRCKPAPRPRTWL